MIELQCRLSSRTDQEMIWPMPFILPKRGKVQQDGEGGEQLQALGEGAERGQGAWRSRTCESTVKPCM